MNWTQLIKDIKAQTAMQIEQMNWAQLIKDLSDTGQTQKDIASVLGCSQPQIVNIAKGRITDIRYSQALKLIEMHKKMCKKRKK